MSTAAVAWVLAETREMQAGRRMILVAAADKVGHEGVVYASLGSLAEVAGCSPDTVRRALDEAVERGWLQQLQWNDRRIPASFHQIRTDRRPNTYKFTGLQDATPSGVTGLQDATPQPSTGVAKTLNRGSTAVLPNPNEPKNTERAARASWHLSIRYDRPPTSIPTSRPHVWRVPSTPAEPQSTVDVLWESVVAVCRLDAATLTTSERGATNRAVEELRAVGADPAEVDLRAERYVSGRGGVPEGTKLTASALARWWASCAPPKRKSQSHPWMSAVCPACGSTWTIPDDGEPMTCSACQQETLRPVES